MSENSRSLFPIREIEVISQLAVESGTRLIIRRTHAPLDSSGSPERAKRNGIRGGEGGSKGRTKVGARMVEGWIAAGTLSGEIEVGGSRRLG